ncbi:receptor-type tyrosine-protein phosphatase C isoform X3 [Pseudorasbora parva]|uniref:receptor-type tyrosine-protein phosphatase C isoform X3 n=1 Tax=Pseudorasbora parva TaxID=51549 RepID=UPI00351E497C
MMFINNVFNLSLSTGSQQDNINSTTSSNTSAPASGGTSTFTSISPSRTSLQQHNTGNNSDTSQKNTSISLSVTTSQQQNTSHTAENITACKNLTCTTTLPSRNTSQQHDTKSTAGNETTLPPNTSTPLLTSTQSSLASPSPSPPFTTSIMATSESPVTCQYSLTKIGDGTISHMVTINGTSNQTYTVTMNKAIIAKESGITPVKIPFKLLKPCTIYNVSVEGCHPIGDPSFIYSDQNETHAQTIVSDSEVCFKGKANNTLWDLECITITQNNSCESIKKDIQFENCSYTVDVILPPVKPVISFNKTIPSQFQWDNKPDKCSSTLNITCNDGRENQMYALNQSVSLLPNTQFSCIGKYPYEKHPIESKSLKFEIECDWQKNGRLNSRSSDSFVISWNVFHGDKCPGFKLDSYLLDCEHKNGKCKELKNGADCTIEGLAPFTNYSCAITAQDINKRKHEIHRDKYETLSSGPKLSSMSVLKTSHNSFDIKCNIETKDWNGVRGNFTAEIKYNGIKIKSLGPKRTCLFSFSDLDYLTTYTIELKATNEQGNSTIKSETTSTSYNDKAVIGFLAFLIFITSIALCFVLFKIYLLKKKRNVEDEEILLTQPLRPVEPIYADGLIEAYKTKVADEGRLFMDEFQSIPRIFSNYTIKEAKKQENQSKNRYVDILPYDYNRVSLSTGGEREYINASFIEGYQEPKKYIAAQGPKDETIDDFWRMVWEQKSSIIVMVTRCEEGNKIKCAQYWPSLDRETEIFEDFVVKIRSEEHCPDYIIRYLVLANKREKASEREVTHIQFISWPDHGVPGDPSLLLKLRRRVNSFKNFFSGPIVVHCSAGVGRTGTYIGIDAMIESLEAEGRVDIYGYVAKLRRQRCLMVQVEAQYILIHTALIEYNQFGDTELSLSEFHSELSTLRQKNESEPSLLEMEFQRLPKFKKWRTINAGSSEDNKKKNRYSSFIPYDFNRVLFRLDFDGNQTSDPEDEDYSSDEEEESNEYINASFIDGYWCYKSLIAAQGPLPDTTEEFLLMLYQQQTKTLIMLTDCQEDGKDYCSQYWGDEKKVFGEMEIEVKKTESFPTYIRRRLELQNTKKKEILEVDQYQFQKWRNSELPENAQDLVEMMRNVRENGNYDNSKRNRNVPIVVHCNNGSSRTGIFCALWNLMDNALTEKLVDVFQVVKNLRKERQGMIETIEQYQFLYTALESAFPVQNGAVKTPPANDSVQVISETTALLTEPNSTTGADQKVAEDSKATESSEQGATENSSTAAPSPAEGDGEKTSTEGTTNGPAAATAAV